MDWLYVHLHVYFYVRCLPRRADKSVLLSMHIWCKTEKLVDMYLYGWYLSGRTRARTRLPVTRRESEPGPGQRWTPDMVSVTFSIHGPSGPSGMKNIFLDDRD